MERERNNTGQMASKQRKFDQQLAEEKKNYQALQSDRDSMEKLARQNETKVLSMQNNISEMEDRLNEVIYLLASSWNFKLHILYTTKADVISNVRKDTKERSIEKVAKIYF